MYIRVVGLRDSGMVRCGMRGVQASPELARLGECSPSSREVRKKYVNQSRGEILLDGAQIRGTCAYA